MIDFRKHRVVLVIVGTLVVAGASIPPLLSASCNARPQQARPGEERALEQLRTMTRNNVLPSEEAVARLESEYPDSKLAALARMVRARIKIKAGDFNGAAQLLDATVTGSRTAVGDYALLMRAGALEQAGRSAEARDAYERLAHDYPTSMRARDARLRVAQLMLQDASAPTALPEYLKELGGKNDGAALLLTAKAYERASDQTRALAAYRRIYFYAPASAESAEAAASITRLNSVLTPATAEEAVTRADKLFEAKRFYDAANAYADVASRFPAALDARTQLRRGVALSNQKRTADAALALNAVPPSAGETRAEAFYHLAQAYANARQWNVVRATLDQMRQAFPQSKWTPRAVVNAGVIARDSKNSVDAAYFFRSAVSSYPNAPEVAQAQFEVAWLAHQSKNYAESSRLLTEHLAYYAEKNTDNRGRAGYWAARDSERAGKLREARALYQAMQGRYDANWYGYLSRQRLEVLSRNGSAPNAEFAPDSLTGRAAASLQTVNVADETAGAAETERVTKADQLNNIGADDWALEELSRALQSVPDSPRVNLAVARVYRLQNNNVAALNTLKKSYPDYSQMKPDEMTAEEWDVFYPLAYWDIITQESRARRLDPFQVAGLIRQESVFNPRARSTAKAYGLMQLVLPTGMLTARRYGVERNITEESLYEPRLNIQLGTGYLRDQLDKYGRIEYVAAAYNAGPGRVEQWRASLPLEIDEWAEAIPFKETRLYVQGVVRNTLQYRRLYDEDGKFRAVVGTHPVHGKSAQGSSPALQPSNTILRQRRTGNEEEDE
ncbi:MAG TPA: transglycosylase SLT domain-containing protein [Pyrinomonadaceae bacterium]